MFGLRRSKTTTPTRACVVDNRTFLLGLDDLYRDRMKAHERAELLHAARTLCRALDLPPQGGPVEGYYTEDALLTEYFQRMRALQDVSDGRRPIVETLPEFRRLLDVCGAALFGQPTFDGKLLPSGKDPLTRALDTTFPLWTIENLLAAAFSEVSESDDFSLVGLAALAKDSVVLAALRETAVLYAQVAYAAAPAPVTIVYEWAVDPIVAERANRFIVAFNELFHETLPAAIPDHAELYWNSCDPTKVHGRCVRLGCDDSVHPIRHYHWAVTFGAAGLTVRDFWSTDLWTTERFRTALASSSALPFPV